MPLLGITNFFACGLESDEESDDIRRADFFGWGDSSS